jgi:hypothetical protein
MQPVVLDERGVPRFRANKIVAALLESSPLDLNRISIRDQNGEFSPGDYKQLMQLTGYSVSGAGGLECFDAETTAEADRQANALLSPSVAASDVPAQPPQALWAFGMALVALKVGHRVRRSNWSEDTLLVLIRPGNAMHICRDTRVAFKMQPCIGLVQHLDIHPGWTASQADMLSDDWSVL